VISARITELPVRLESLGPDPFIDGLKSTQTYAVRGEHPRADSTIHSHHRTTARVAARTAAERSRAGSRVIGGALIALASTVTGLLSAARARGCTPVLLRVALVPAWQPWRPRARHACASATALDNAPIPTRTTE